MKFLQGNLFDSNAEALVNTVNTVGVMGKGLALQFKNRFPTNFKLYERACKSGEVVIGKMFITSTNNGAHPKWIINFPTKTHWKESSEYSFIQAGLKDLKHQIQQLGIRSIAIPPLGAGLGGLEWDKVKQMIVHELSELDMEVLVYEPDFIDGANLQIAPSALTKSRSLILTVALRYVKLGNELTRLELQKLAYFLQRIGQSDLKLHFKQYHYGPYAHNLQHLIQSLENGFIVSAGSMHGARPLDAITLNPLKVHEVESFLQTHTSPEEQARIDQLFALIEGYETPFGLELLSTVDWVVSHSGKAQANAQSIKEGIAQWSKRKDDQFTLHQVSKAAERLSQFTSLLVEAH